jgi:hypothetical protein
VFIRAQSITGQGSIAVNGGRGGRYRDTVSNCLYDGGGGGGGLLGVSTLNDLSATNVTLSTQGGYNPEKTTYFNLAGSPGSAFVNDSRGQYLLFSNLNVKHSVTYTTFARLTPDLLDIDFPLSLIVHEWGRLIFDVDGSHLASFTAESESIVGIATSSLIIDDFVLGAKVSISSSLHLSGKSLTVNSGGRIGGINTTVDYDSVIIKSGGVLHSDGSVPASLSSAVGTSWPTSNRYVLSLQFFENLIVSATV